MNDTIKLPETRSASFEMGEDGTVRDHVHNTESMPFLVDAWQDQPEHVREQLGWLAQHRINEGWSLKQIAQRVGRSESAWSRILKDEYHGGDLEAVARDIEAFRKTLKGAGMLRDVELVDNRFTKWIQGTLEFAFEEKGMALITGRSGVCKSEIAKRYAMENARRCCYVTAQDDGGIGQLLRDIAKASGHATTRANNTLKERLFDSFNRHRMLIIDDAEFLVPAGGHRRCSKLSFLRTLHDRTGVVIVLVAQSAFHAHLDGGFGVYEQHLGRMFPRCVLPAEVTEEDIAPIVAQYVSRVSKQSLAVAQEFANRKTGIRGLVKLLRWGCRKFSAGEKMNNEQFPKAVKAFDMLEGKGRRK